MVRHVNIGAQRVLHRPRKTNASCLVRHTIHRLLIGANVSPLSIRTLLYTDAAPSCRFPSATSLLVNEVNLAGTFNFSVRTTYTKFLCTVRVNTTVLYDNHFGQVVLINNSRVSSTAGCGSHGAYPVFTSNTNTILVRTAASRVNLVSDCLHTSNGDCPALHVDTNKSTYPPARTAISTNRRAICRRNHGIFGRTIAGVDSTITAVTRQGRLAGRGVA